ncbi:MAG: hypothetical protein IH596_09210 [Bacteroidales bacterium]|nr:hypothetical protein [Bacteroidales bacterium]
MFEKFLKERFGNSYLKECPGLFGIPDFVFYAKENNEMSIISFELKLKNWKRAATQAFRYKSFSNIAYVVLSPNTAEAALNGIALFKKYNIGLAKFDSRKRFEILFKPESVLPYSEHLNQKLISSLSKSRKKSKNLEILTRPGSF